MGERGFCGDYVVVVWSWWLVSRYGEVGSGGDFPLEKILVGVSIRDGAIVTVIFVHEDLIGFLAGRFF